MNNKFVEKWKIMKGISDDDFLSIDNEHGDDFAYLPKRNVKINKSSNNKIKNKILGLIMILIPFVLAFLYGLLSNGIIVTLQAFAFAIGITFAIIGTFWLIIGGIWLIMK